MAERTVPAFVPDFEDPDKFKRWEDANASDREAWAAMMDHHDKAMVESAAMMLAHGGERADVPGLVQFLWNFLDKDDAKEFVMAHGSEIADRANQINGVY